MGHPPCFNIRISVKYCKMVLRHIIFFYIITTVTSHLPEHLTTPANKIDYYCLLAQKCIHDTVPICGQLGTEFRSFLDSCDLLEFACDFNKVYSHVDNRPDCPLDKPVEP